MRRDACPVCHKKVRVSIKGLLYKHSGNGVMLCQGSYCVCSQEKGIQEKMLSLRPVIEEAIKLRIEQVEKNYVLG